MDKFFEQAEIIYDQFGVVILGIDDLDAIKISQHHVDNKNVCTKNCIRLKREAMYQSLLDIEKVLPYYEDIQQNQVVKFSTKKQQDKCQEIQGCFVIMERASTDLFKQIFSNYNQIKSFEICKEIAIQVCESVKEVHDKGLAHNDIKSDNFFYFNNGDIDIQVKIADFGYCCSNKMNKYDKFIEIFGSKNRRLLTQEVKKGLAQQNSLIQPEIDLDLQKSDIYNLGYLLFELVYQISMKYLFEEENLEYFLQNEYGDFVTNLKEGHFFPIIKGCLSEQPNERFTIDEILQKLQCI
ncbi:Protein kinase-like domain [Pseudocohnilembus persalinus]|uniref:Protein kinase-like domain n=1 Tax=Pseudocohnilembus persalinus TaxID=266149 RepID=A0A0V0QTM5_PSEPJ|nr:Protein kinase-like domain [Pseudocohnilembus persalinus]|eukprot:KRX05553.1 Protein kinase-like domain [Pseudocohnilembus persalinus]